MNKEFKGYKEGCRYLVKDDGKFWDTSFELMEIYILEISEKAIKIKFDNGDAKWYLKETFNFSMIENLSVDKQTIEKNSQLEWQQNPPKKTMTWYEAMEYAKSLGDGWRLPTRGELSDAYDNGVEGFQKSYYWAEDDWAFNFNNGYLASSAWESDCYFLRCVKKVSAVELYKEKILQALETQLAVVAGMPSVYRKGTIDGLEIAIAKIKEI